jgi:hypothetical protein
MKLFCQGLGQVVCQLKAVALVKSGQIRIAEQPHSARHVLQRLSDQPPGDPLAAPVRIDEQTCQPIPASDRPQAQCADDIRLPGDPHL